MDNKEEIIEYLKEYKFFGNIKLSHHSDVNDYEATMKLYYKWCKYLNYPEKSYESLYYFFSEFYELELRDVNRNKPSLCYIKKERSCRIYDSYDGTFYIGYYDKLLELGYDKL